MYQLIDEVVCYEIMLAKRTYKKPHKRTYAAKLVMEIVSVYMVKLIEGQPFECVALK